VKIPSDKLYRLIRSLSPAEKRYFRIFVRGRTDRDSKYLHLFEVLAGMETFDDAVAQKKIYKSQPSGQKKYPELKAYLYDLILKCLHSFQDQHHSGHRIRQILDGVEVLFRRGDYEDCRDLLQKAGKIARQYEAFSFLLEIIRWEKQLAYSTMDTDLLHHRLAHWLHEESYVLEQLQRVSEYSAAFFQMYLAIKRGAQERGEDRLSALKTIVQQEIFTHIDYANSHKARVLYYRTLNLYHYAAVENQTFYETGRYLIALIETQPHFLKEDISEYIAALNNLILSCGLLGKYEEVRLCLRKLRQLQPVTEDDRRKIHRQYYTNLFALCITTGTFEEARREIEQCRRESQQFNQKEYEASVFIFQYCVICFGCGDYDDALGFLNQWLGLPRSVEREDLQSLARILSLILHFEMGNNILLDSLVRSATRFMKVKNRFYDLEKDFIHCIAEASRVTLRREQQKIFERMLSNIREGAVANTVRPLLQIFDLEAWLTARVTGQSFAQVVAEKYSRTTTHGQ
jgi:hypothetical protein